ncbi:filamentous haemagglutinin family protein [Luteimonas sp. R10]|uniref:filamentous haemagglutinin family protein n=1 Tax=Luteimonas sp. R10 TaxID=3108176 RepID=UPI003089B3CC|nr:filamentous hemagglutinin family protein [Luteimonas sp. R10]
MHATTPRDPSFRAPRLVFRTAVHPLSRAIAALLLAGGVTGTVSAQQAFSPAWFANKGEAQGNAAATGLLPNGLPAHTLTGPQQQSQAARERLQTSLENLNTAAQAIAMQQRLQQQARDAALVRPSDLPDGLGEGGLKIDENELTKGWHNAKDPTQTVADGQTTVSIEQTGDRAILNWETFNVGRHTTVDFAQQADWSLLNRVNDPNARPSQIQGQINADGTVFLLNRNGVLFEGSSQVNVRNLVAAAAQMSDSQFSASGLYGANGAASFTDAGGAVTVAAGAQIRTHAPQSVTEGGGYVLLLGTEVGNAGEIATVRGQTQLAAGDGFVIRRGVGTEGNQHSTTRGNEVAVLRNADGVDDAGAPLPNPAGTVTNSGLIQAREGDITLAGHAVRQDGVAVATTTVNTRGTIHLLNSAGDATGRVALGEGATTAVLIEDDGETTALDSQRDALIAESAAMDAQRMGAAAGVFDNYSRLSDRRDQSRIEIVSGGDVAFAGDSLTLATGGQIAVSAGDRAFVADGARLDVAGAVGVQVAMASNAVRVNVQGNELRDSPHNRDSGALFNSNVWVDTRELIYVPAGTGGYASDRWYTADGLLEVGGYLGNQGHGIGAWAAQGGTVTLGGHEVVTQAGSTVNIAGGTLDVQTGSLNQTWLRTGAGQVYALGQGPVDATYAGTYIGYALDHARWGVEEAFFSPVIAPRRRLENGYTVGRDAGRLIVSAPTAVLEGAIVADVFDGERQAHARADGVSDGYKLGQNTAARAGTVALGQYGAFGREGVYNTDVVIGDVENITAGLATDNMLPVERMGTAWFDATYLNDQKLGGIDFATDGKITIDAPLSVADGGSVSLIAPIVDIEADITARSGSITATNHFAAAGLGGVSTELLTSADAAPGVTVAQGVTLDVRGLWVNELQDGAIGGKRAFIDGGDVRLVSSGEVTLAEGSLIDASSGGRITASGEFEGGRGGDVTLRADAAIMGPGTGVGLLTLDGDIRAYGVTGGGTLRIETGSSIVIDGQATETQGVLAAGESADVSLILAEDYTVAAGELLPMDVVLTRIETPIVPPGERVPSSVTWSGSVTTAADWVIPALAIGGDRYIYTSTGERYTRGDTVPAGAVLVSGVLLTNMLVPADVFPDGFPLMPTPVDAHYAAGTPAPEAVTLAAGGMLMPGTVLPRDATIRPVLELENTLFQKGFSRYEVSSATGMLVASGSQIDVTMPVYRLGAEAPRMPTGSDPEAVLELWTPPLYIENDHTLTLTQRKGADVSFSAGHAEGNLDAPLTIGSGAAVTVDPGHSISLSGTGQVTVEGELHARSGAITIRGGSTEHYVAGRSIWIGEHAVLDAAARAATATTASGRTYGWVSNGGSITIGAAEPGFGSNPSFSETSSPVIVRPGARLDASGTSAVLDLPIGTTEVASSGGAITLASALGIAFEGTMRAAAGGIGAAGGTLSLGLESTLMPPMGSDVAKTPRILTVTQRREAPELPGGLAPGADDPALPYGGAWISAEEVDAGGFGNLALWSADVIRFDGDVSLSLSESLALHRGVIALADATPDAQVRLAAPYVRLDGMGGLKGEFGKIYPGLDEHWLPSAYNGGRLTAEADLIDIGNAVLFGVSGRYMVDGNQSGQPVVYVDFDAPGFAEIELTSRGDIRFRDGGLVTAGNLTLTAAQLYPVTSAATTIIAGAGSDPSGTRSIVPSPDGVLTIRSNGSPLPPLPASAFGTLTLIGGTIDQGGVLRAPLGKIYFGKMGLATPSDPRFSISTSGTGGAGQVVLRDGSATSVSAAGLLLPYGGTVDGITYLYDGVEVDITSLLQLSDAYEGSTGRVIPGPGEISIESMSLIAEPGSVLDLSGGGDLAGAGFISGRGGSVDVLRTPLVNSNPAYGFSAAGNQIYAILPGYVSGYAPIAPDNGAGDPAIGQQITVPSGVPGLPAGTYTLLPSTYALLPGAYRVELGDASLLGQPAVLGNGSWFTGATLGIANTSIRDAVPTGAVITAGNALRTYSQYSEASYSRFVLDTAARFGTTRGRLPADGKLLTLGFANTGEVLSFEGSALLAPEEGGYAGALTVSADSLEIKASGAAATPDTVSLDAEDLSHFSAGTLLIGGLYKPQTGSEAQVNFSGAGSIAVREGAVLEAGQIILSGSDVLVESGAVLDTTHSTVPVPDSSLGFVFANNGNSVVAVAEGRLNFLPAEPDETSWPPKSLVVEDGAVLTTRGSIGFLTNGDLTLGQAVLNARDLTLGLNVVNAGTDTSLAAAAAAGILAPGWMLTQEALDRLLDPSDPNLPALEQLTLAVHESINFFGDVALDARNGADDAARTTLVLNTPAIYGWGAEGASAVLAADRLVWNGVATGAGTDERPYGSLTPPAVLPGGAGTGSGQLTLAAREILLGYDPMARSQDNAELERLALGFSSVNVVATDKVSASNRGSLSVYTSGTDAGSYAGGDLTITTPLLTAESGALIDIRAGGNVMVVAAGQAADPATRAELGGEVRLEGAGIALDTTVALPSGRLVLMADGDIAFGDRALIDLSGRAITFFDETKYSWGGSLEMESRSGRIDQAAGSMIDVSAENNNAGSIEASATGAGGMVTLAGTLSGTSSGGFAMGGFTLAADTIADFVGLNNRLTQTGFLGARSFTTKSGDLAVGDEVKAGTVTIAVDGGSLTVAGRIDASGEKPGAIRLSSRDDLSLAPDAVLDAHGTVLQTDSYGAAIEAKNRGHVELTARQGMVTLAPGSVIDLSTPDGAARGQIEINAPRLGGNDIAIDAASGVAIQGAASIAVNGFRSYTPSDGSIDQAYLDGIHADSAGFIDAALANGSLQTRLAGLQAYGDAFHLRPGVEIVSEGDLATSGDLDLSGYRYGPDTDSGIRGLGEPGVLVIRAGGNIDIEGSINDGFAPPPATPDDGFFGDGGTVVIPAGTTRPDDWTLETDLAVLEDWVVPNTPFYQDFWGYIYDTSGIYYGPGEVVAAGTTLAAWSAVFEAGTPLPSYASVGFGSGRMWAVAPMLEPGALSWSMRLVAGADLMASDTRTVAPVGALAGGGNLVLDNLHRTVLDEADAISVVRTGTGYLDLIAGGDYRHDTLFGVYTAGTALPTAETADYSVPRGTVFGSALGGYSDYEMALSPTRMWFTEGGGDVTIAAGGSIAGYEQYGDEDSAKSKAGDWLWRQGNESLGQPTAWGINFGTYVFDPLYQRPQLVGFSGIGALGGGNVAVKAGGDAGVTTAITSSWDTFSTSSTLVVAVAGSGRVGPDGVLRQTGGGDLTLDIGGRLNPAPFWTKASDGASGMLVNLRGDIAVTASTIGHMMGAGYGQPPPGDPRPTEPMRPYQRVASGGLALVLGDSRVAVNTGGDLAINNVIDPGRVPTSGSTPAAEYGGLSDSIENATWFTLWTGRTAVDLFSAGGSVALARSGSDPTALYLPSALGIVAAGGDIVMAGGEIILMPSPSARLDYFARDSILQGSATLSGGSPDDIATPFRPAWTLSDFMGGQSGTLYATNYWADDRRYDPWFNGGELFTFGLDTVGDLGDLGADPMRFYALHGDIINFKTGETSNVGVGGESLIFHRASRPVRMLAGRDLFGVSGLILHGDERDVSIIQAGRDIVWGSFDIAGPGVLEVSAGRNLYQAGPGGNQLGKLTSIGPLVPGDQRPGASIVMQAGAGPQGPDYAGLMRYLDPANLLPAGTPLDGSGKLAKTYESELAQWLEQRYGFDGAVGEAQAFFSGLAPEQQRIFLREIYYAELRAGGREYNAPDSRRFGSYLRGREAIAALFPETDENGNPVVRGGDIIMYGGNEWTGASGVRTLFGGDIQILAPHGQIVVGVEGQVPPSSAGVITQGSGDIQMYSKDSILLGLSRIMTTFGGDILAWSAEGDINAGRGAKSTLVYTPPRRVYDDVGNVTLSPQVPSTGAGIATLDPIPEVPPGDIDLIAPLGTIDAGEAGIRVSGNVNLAALQVVNAENIQVQGEATGLPATAAVNVAALTSTSVAANSAVQAAQDMVQRQTQQSRPSIISVEVLGFGDRTSSRTAPLPGAVASAAPRAGYDPGSAFQVLGNGALDEAQRGRLTTAERNSLE